MAAKKLAVYVLRYERADGQFREINLSAGSEAEARELSDRRLEEQFGYRTTRHEEPVLDASGNPTHDDEGREVMREVLERFPPTHNGVERPDLLQENYAFHSIRHKGKP